MNNAWSLALRAPCAGLRASSCSFRAVTPSVTSKAVDGLLWSLGRQRQCFRPFSLFAKRPLSWGTNAGNGLPFGAQPRTPALAARFSSKKRQGKQPDYTTQLPEDYNPEEGVRFRSKDLSPKEIKAIFGPQVDTALANHVLRLLQGRRLSGTLDETFHVPENSGLTEENVLNALGWLRVNYPVDEEAALLARVERETLEAEQKYQADAQRLGIYKPLEEQTKKKESVYGESGLDAIREHYQSLPVKEYKWLQPRPGEEKTGTLENVGGTGQLAKREPSERMKYYMERAAVTANKAPPQMTKLQRLYPSILVSVVVVSLCLVLSTSYTPPPRSARLWPDLPPAAATVLGLILANTFIFVLWRVPPAWHFLNKYFMSVPGWPVALSNIGNVFSHQQIGHLAMNMAMLWYIGTKLHDDTNRATFLSIYLSSGVLASLFSLSSHVLRNNFVTSSLGASGAIAGIVAAWCLLNSE
ncbi:MAG: hypothetical protein M1819_000055 [Sarea resinae]|nr:MAG: hypothetical protein M1819_000055 [Sarea resinae]